MLQPTKVPCPFCDNEIEVLYSPPSHTTRRSKSALGTGSNPVFSKESYEVLKPCPHCGKPANAIKKTLIKPEGKPVPKDEMIKRMKEAGIPLRF